MSDITRWEYTNLGLPWDESIDKITESNWDAFYSALNEMGRAGWELVTIHHDMAYLKRPKQDKPVAYKDLVKFRRVGAGKYERVHEYE